MGARQGQDDDDKVREKANACGWVSRPREHVGESCSYAVQAGRSFLNVTNTTRKRRERQKDWLELTF